VAVIGEYMRMSAAELTKGHSVQMNFDPMLEVPALSERSLQTEDYIIMPSKMPYKTSHTGKKAKKKKAKKGRRPMKRY